MPGNRFLGHPRQRLDGDLAHHRWLGFIDLWRVLPRDHRQCAFRALIGAQPAPETASYVDRQVAIDLDKLDGAFLHACAAQGAFGFIQLNDEAGYRRGVLAAHLERFHRAAGIQAAGADGADAPHAVGDVMDQPGFFRHTQDVDGFVGIDPPRPALHPGLYQHELSKKLAAISD